MASSAAPGGSYCRPAARRPALPGPAAADELPRVEWRQRNIGKARGLALPNVPPVAGWVGQGLVPCRGGKLSAALHGRAELDFLPGVPFLHLELLREQDAFFEVAGGSDGVADVVSHGQRRHGQGEVLALGGENAHWVFALGAGGPAGFP